MLYAIVICLVLFILYAVVHVGIDFICSFHYLFLNLVSSKEYICYHRLPPSIILSNTGNINKNTKTVTLFKVSKRTRIV